MGGLGRKVTSVKRVERRNEKLHAAVVKMYKTLQARTTFLKLRCGKIARRCGEKHVFNQNAPLATCSDHFWKLRCQKIARRCSEKHIFKSKCTKHLRGGPLFEVAMSKNCTPLWREAHFEVKMYKTLHSRTTFGSCDVEKLHAAVARSAFSSQNIKKLRGTDHFLKLRCGKMARRCSEKHICK